MKTFYIKQLYVVALLTLLSLNCKANFTAGPKSSKTSLKEGDAYFKHYRLKEAVLSYQEAIKGSTDKKMYLTRQLAKSYRLLFDYQNASIWYEKLMEFSSDIVGQDILEYAQILKNMEMYDKAIDVYDLYLKRMQLSNSTPSTFKASCIWAKEHINDKSDYDLVLTSMDTKGVFLGADFYNSGLMYGTMQKNPDETMYSDLYYSKMPDSVTFSNPEKIPGKTNSLSNDAQPSISTDGKTMYFTRNTTDIFFYNPKKSKSLEINPDGISLLNIYVSVNKDGEWSAPKRLTFNSKEFSCAYPFIDTDGKTLYFSSNRPGGFGGFDIYKAVLKNDSVFSAPENLGKDINSDDDDFAPRVYDHKLYYASRGKGGFGGADMFMSTIGSNGKLSTAQNMGISFNSSKDDFYLLFKSNYEEGYFASNRDGEHGEDKLYYFKKTPPPFDTISGIVLDRITNAKIQGATVNLYELNGKGDSLLVNTTTSDAEGFWLFPVSPLKSYSTTFSFPDYYSRRYIIPAMSKDKTNKRKDAMAGMKEVKLSPVVKKNNIVKINNIYFDFNKANIRSESYSILNNLLGFLNENPAAMIELSAHTDGAGNDKYNLKLSDNRAISCYEYLIGNGIDKKRIVPRGYGETRLLNNCKDAKKCSDAENQLNRRVEVKFL
ncbi:MAG: OmpA family protein [Bacteroidota bacterium]